MKPNQLFVTEAILLVALFVSACAPASTQDAHTGHLIDSAPVSNSAERASQPSRTIKVNTNDEMRFVPERLTVQAGETVQFEVTNTGVLTHEFILGNAHLQAEHAKTMNEGDEMHHGDASTYALSIAPGETATLVYTFDQASDLFYGCHVPGHYAAGMKGTITVATVN